MQHLQLPHFEAIPTLFLSPRTYNPNFSIDQPRVSPISDFNELEFSGPEKRITKMVSNQQEKISNYFLEQAKLNASSSGDDINDDENEPLPNELNTVNSSGGFLVVSTDKLSVKYTNVNLHGHDVGVIQANHPAPVKRIMYYFEMTVKNAGTKGQIAIGFTTESFKMRRQPGLVS